MAMTARTDANSLAARIEANSIPEPNSGCYLWTAGVTEFGYGKIGIRLPSGQKRTMTAHRLAYELRYGKVPSNLVVMHRCDVPACVNVDHLRLGTQAENLSDMCNKGRANPKCLPPHARSNSKLTWEIVRLIRSSDKSAKSLARMFGVSDIAIGRVRNGIGWREIS